MSRATIDEGSQRIYDILKEKNEYMSLEEIYIAYEEKYPNDIYPSKASFESSIRRFIYKRCIDRDIRDTEQLILFCSKYPKHTIGNSYGLIEWGIK